MTKNIFLFHVAIICLTTITGCFTSSKSEKLGEELVFLFYLNTANVPCAKNPYKDPFEFLDSQNDERGGFLNTEPSKSIIDILSGNYSSTEKEVKFDLQLRELPEYLDVNLIEDSTSPEITWMFHFSGNLNYKVGVSHFTNQKPEKKRVSTFIPSVWVNQNWVGGCGHIQVLENTISWKCDFDTIPELTKIGDSESLMVDALLRRNEAAYYDCF